jgi:hypothetical protein
LRYFERVSQLSVPFRGASYFMSFCGSLVVQSTCSIVKILWANTYDIPQQTQAVSYSKIYTLGVVATFSPNNRTLRNEFELIRAGVRGAYSCTGNS